MRANFDQDRNSMRVGKIEFEARVTANGEKQSVFGRVKQVDGSGIIVLLPKELGMGETVDIEMADSLPSWSSPAR